jgi:hypothetical protein
VTSSPIPRDCQGFCAISDGRPESDNAKCMEVSLCLIYPVEAGPEEGDEDPSIFPHLSAEADSGRDDRAVCSTSPYLHQT